MTTLKTPLMKKKKAYSYIRFSTPEQAKGNSLQRQYEKTLAYAKKHNLELDNSLQFQDLGVSGFKGDNVESGALKKFKDAVESGRIPAGSTLIVESFDRLGRTAILKQLSVFLDLIGKGITIVTLTDEKSYSEKSLNDNAMDLMMSLLIMSRAYEESQTKALRLSAAWKAKRLRGGMITSLCPAWLKYNRQTKVFVINEERAALVKRIFEMAVAGIGNFTIAKKFNLEGIAVWGDGTQWHTSYIQKILGNRGVIGEFQPHTKKNGKRFPEGEPIKDYYPAIIPEELFYRAIKKRETNKRFAGKVGDNPSCQ